MHSGSEMGGWALDLSTGSNLRQEEHEEVAMHDPRRERRGGWERSSIDP
jgi:hypothetical protein